MTHFLVRIAVEIAKAICQRQLVLELSRRAVGYVEKPEVVCLAVTRGAFDDVGGHRDRASAQLGAQAEVVPQIGVHAGGQLSQRAERPGHPRRQLRRFGLVMAVALGVFGGLFQWREPAYAPYLFAAAGFFAVVDKLF